MERPGLKSEKKQTPEERAAQERQEELRQNANRISRQILTLTRNGLFVTLRFMDVALCQFQYLSADQLPQEGPVKIRTIATTGEHMIFRPQYIMERYMSDRQSLSRDYLHIVLHCIFRHPFVSTHLDREAWDLAADIAVENIIVDLDLKQTRTRSADEIEKAILEIREMVPRMNAEALYRFLKTEDLSYRTLERWKKLFRRDDHAIWWVIAEEIEEEMKRRAKEQSQQEEAGEKDAPDSQNDEEDTAETEETEPEDSETAEEGDGEDTEDDLPDSEEGEEESGDSEDEAETEEEPADEASDEETPDDPDPDAMDEDDDPYGDGRPEEEDESFDEYEDEYSSTPGQSMQRENENDLADPDSDTHDTGEDASEDGSGGGNPGDTPEQSEAEGDERKGDDVDTGGMEGQDDPNRQQSEEKPQNELSGNRGEGKPDESGEDSSGEEQQNPGGSPQDGAQQQKGHGKQGEHSAGTGGGGEGSQSAWEHSSGGANRRGDGERDLSDRGELSGDVNPEDPEEVVGDDGRKLEAKATGGTAESPEEEQAPSYMHDGEEQKELEEKWKEISERMLVDLETSSKEWGDKSDAMVQGIKKINKDKYDYATFLRKFSALHEDIQLNDDEFDYVYYTLGLDRYRNIPLIEPLEYKEVRKVRDFVIAIDTSGSCSGEVVQKFLDKTYSIFKQQENFFKKINLHIIQCDAQIQSDVKITDREEFDEYMKNIEFQGFGGTDFRPVFQYVDELIERREFEDLKGLIYFTDGNGTYPKKRPDYETAFIFVDDDEFEYDVPAWAMKLVLETSDITEEVLI